MKVGATKGSYFGHIRKSSKFLEPPLLLALPTPHTHTHTHTKIWTYFEKRFENDI
jgi:hypothetical protein